MQGMSVANIAEHLGIPVGTVKIRLFRGRAVLREKLHRLDQQNS
jgi:DNA-directed RNA polymerase specialized sigma24 family protein